MPKDERYLTDATKDTLTDNVSAISRGWDKSSGYIYEILREDKADPFAPFLSLYKGVVRSGISTCHFDNELEFIRTRFAKNKPAKEATECFTEKLNVQNLTMAKFIESLKDGELDIDEIKELEMCLEREKQNIQMIEVMLNFKRSVLER
jgi:hypothetical protein